MEEKDRITGREIIEEEHSGGMWLGDLEAVVLLICLKARDKIFTQETAEKWANDAIKALKSEFGHSLLQEELNDGSFDSYLTMDDLGKIRSWDESVWENAPRKRSLLRGIQKAIAKEGI